MKVFSFILTLCIVMSTTACVDDMNWEKNSQETEHIRFCEPNIMYIQSRSIASEAMGDTLISVVDNDSLFLKYEARALGQEMASRTISTSDDISSFSVNAFYREAENLFMRMQDVNVTVEDDNCKYSPVAYWPHEQQMDFLACAAVADGEISRPQLQIVPDFNDADGKGWYAIFDHTLPVNAQDEGKDAQSQADLMFAVRKGVTDKKAVSLDFYHALSAIEFKVGSMPEGTHIDRISISGVKGNGTCTVFVNSEGVPVFKWTVGGNEYECMQDMGRKKAGEAGSVLSDKTSTFMMIPQTLTKNARITIDFTIADMSYSFQTSISKFTEKWEAGWIYTYSISLKEFSELDINSQLNGKRIKSNVYIQNTGLTSSFLRVTVNGYWQDSLTDEFGNPIIIMAWDIHDNIIGSVEWGTSWNDYWIEHEENGTTFYYYKYPVNAGEFTEVPFFQEYVLTANPPSIDSKLEINIIAQIIGVDQAAAYWGVNISDGGLSFKTE